jgi:hypothetical protein
MKFRYPEEWDPNHKSELNWKTYLMILGLLGLVYLIFYVA